MVDDNRVGTPPGLSSQGQITIQSRFGNWFYKVLTESPGDSVRQVSHAPGQFILRDGNAVAMVKFEAL